MSYINAIKALEKQAAYHLKDAALMEHSAWFEGTDKEITEARELGKEFMEAAELLKLIAKDTTTV